MTGFQLADAEVYLLLADDTIVTPTGSTETANAENPFELRDVYEFSDLPEDAELDQAVLYVRIAQVTLTTTDGSIDVLDSGMWAFPGTTFCLIRRYRKRRKRLIPEPWGCGIFRDGS